MKISINSVFKYNEELAHLEMVGTIVHQLTYGVSPQKMEKAGLGTYYTDHGVGIYPKRI